jgi:hypothetical protein
MKKSLPLALAIALASHAALADEDALTTVTAQAVQNVSMIISGGVIAGAASGANAIAGSFNDATGLIAILQNTGSNVLQSAQNVMALRVPCYCSGPVRTEATSSQVAHLSIRNTRVDQSGASGSNTISGSFANASGSAVVMQNTGTNVVQSAQNTVAMAVRQP